MITLSPEQKRIRIAEACGWTYRQIAPGSPLFWHDPSGVPKATHELPDFCNDLNAMHEAVEVLPQLQRIAFENTLIKMCRNYAPHAIHATASQRADAFLLTL